MAKKQKSFADKASDKGADVNADYVKYVESVRSKKTGFWRFNEQIIKVREGEQLDAALKRIKESENLVDIDLSQFINNPATEEPATEEPVVEEPVVEEPEVEEPVVEENQK